MSRVYPTISQYIEAIQIPDSFATRKSLKPVIKEDGTPFFSSGNFAVVFKMKDESTGEVVAVKCFLRDVENRDESYRLISEYLNSIESEYLVPHTYLQNELWVDGYDYSVLIMKWIEGETLDKCINRIIREENKPLLENIIIEFDKLALFLYHAEFAHCDIKPENILITKDKKLILVDYDALFIPSMKGELARECGTYFWSNPNINEIPYDSHFDDYSLLTISTVLYLTHINFKNSKSILNPDMSVVHDKWQKLFQSDNTSTDNIFNLLCLAARKNQFIKSSHTSFKQFDALGNVFEQTLKFNKNDFAKNNKVLIVDSKLDKWNNCECIAADLYDFEKFEFITNNRFETINYLCDNKYAVSKNGFMYAINDRGDTLTSTNNYDFMTCVSDAKLETRFFIAGLANSLEHVIFDYNFNEQYRG